MSQGITLLVVKSWWQPGRVIDALRTMSEGALLAMLLAACVLLLAAQVPGHVRAAQADPTIPLDGRMAGAALAVLFILPICAYMAAGGAALIARLFGVRLSGHASRLALFWALLAVTPAMLLAGVVEGLAGPGLWLSLCRIAAGVGFVMIWGAGIRALAGHR